MRALRVLLAAAAVLLVATIGAAWLLPAWLDPARVRAALERAASDRLGATVTIEGPVRFVLLPRPVLKAGRVSLLHGAPGDPDALAVTADTLAAKLDLRALLHGHLAAANLMLDHAEAQAPFPFDVRMLTAGRPAALTGTAITWSDARIRLGPFTVEQAQGQLAADPLTGDAILAGTFRLPGGSAWRASLRLSQAGGDGSAALNAGLEEIYAAEGPTASLTGQIAGDGGFGGRFTVSGQNLARLMPSPAVPFTANGRASLAGGIATLDDAAVTLDAVPCHLDASLYLPPQPRLDLKLSASRLDLDAWRHALATAAVPPLPIALEVGAEAASLAGGALRQVRAGLTLDGRHLAVRGLEAGLPGGMTLQADGTADLAAATSRFDLRLDGPDLRTTASWLGGSAGLSTAELPEGMFRALTGRATIGTSGTEIEAHDIAASLDGVGVRGDAIFSLTGGHPNTAAILSLDRLDVAPLLAPWRAGGPLWPWPGVDAAIQLSTPRALLPGMEAASLGADFALHDGALEVHDLHASSPSWHVQGHFDRSTEGRWSDAELALGAGHAANLLPLLPADWRERVAVWPALTTAPLQATLKGAGTPEAMSGSLAADLGALHVEAAGDRRAGGDIHVSLGVRHPGASGLGRQLGVGAAFLGDGSLSATTDASYAEGVLTADTMRLHAGLLDMTGGLRLDLSGAMPALSGRIEAPVLRLPGLDWHSTAPLPLSVLHGWKAALDITAARVETAGDALSDLHGHVTLGDVRLDVSDLAATLPGGGRVTGSLGLNAAVLPPVGSADLAISDARLGVRNWHPLDLLASNLSAKIALQGQGFAPATMLATLHGNVSATSHSASVMGIDVGTLGANLSEAAVRAALGGGRTLLDSATVSLAINQGLATLDATGIASGGAQLAASGGIDLTAATIDLDLAITPAITDPPRIRLRLSGDAERATLAQELSDLTRWRAARE